MTTFTCISPIDGSVLAERQTDRPDHIERALAKAHAAQRAWARVPVGERTGMVLKAIAALAAMDGEVVPELARQMGRPVRYGGEIGGVKERTSYMMGIAESALAPVVIEDSERFNRVLAREPLGLVLVIAPWNYPYLTAINTIAPALAAGNAVFLKHATQTLLVGERFAAAFAAAGLPEGLFTNIVLTHDTMDALIAGRRFDFLNFTGSVAGGKAVEQAAAGTFTGVGLELGGKDPGYVRADADLDAAVAGLIDGALFNSGQSCCGIERIYVHEALYDQFVDRAAALANGYILGDPLAPETTLGPMANIRFASQVRAQVGEALAAGARGLVDPARFPADTGATAYVAPQILVEVDHSMRVMVEETFGPVVGIMKVASDAEAIALMNDSPYGLTAALWTRDAEAASRIGRELATGTIYMNRCDYLDPALCWSGHKDTGRGASLSALGFLSVTRSKSYHLKKA